MLLKMSVYVKNFKNGDKDDDKNKNNKLCLFRIDNKKLLEKYVEQDWRLKNIELKALSVCDDSYIKTKREHMVINFILIFVV